MIAVHRCPSTMRRSHAAPVWSKSRYVRLSVSRTWRLEVGDLLSQREPGATADLTTSSCACEGGAAYFPGAREEVSAYADAWLRSGGFLIAGGSSLS